MIGFQKLLHLIGVAGQDHDQAATIISSAQAVRPGVSTLVPKGRHAVATGDNPWMGVPTRLESPEGAT